MSGGGGGKPAASRQPHHGLAHSSGCPNDPHAGDPEAALQDAEAALQLLCEEAQGEDPGTAACGSDVAADSPLAAQLAKAFHRKAEALLALGRVLDGIKTYRQGVAVCGPRPELHAALRLASEQLPVPWLAKVCWRGRVKGSRVEC